MQNEVMVVGNQNMNPVNRPRRRILWGLGIFLALMFVCMLVSKSIYASQLPIVSVASLESKYIEHIITAEGIVAEGSSHAVTALSGLRVGSVRVQTGDHVEAGDVLFTIDIADVERLIEEKQTQIDKLSLQIAAIEGNQELARQKRELETERAREDYDKTAQEQDTDVGRALQAYEEAEEALNEHLESPWSESWEEEKEALEEALQQAAYAEEAVRRERDHSMTQAERKVEDSEMTQDADPTLEVYRLERSAQQQELALYQEILDIQGEVKAETSGVVTAVQIEAGGRIPDSAALLLADESVPFRFHVTLGQEQKKYVKLGDVVAIKLDGGKTSEQSVDYLAQSQTSPSNFEAYVTLPQGVGRPGLSGTMVCSQKGEKHAACLPNGAVYTENNRNFVYVLREREGILGMEYYVDEVTVRILDRNEDWTALEEGMLNQDSAVIVSATKEIKKGQTVRKEGS